MTSREHETNTKGSEEREQLIELYRTSLDSLHRFSDTAREIGTAAGDLIEGNRGAILDMCAAIEALLDHDLTRVSKPEYAEINVAGESYNPDDLATETLEGVVSRLRKRVEAMGKPADSHSS